MPNDHPSALPPKVFLCHATEDKDRFVTGFAKALIERGIDVWYDDWEMLPGASLVQKIFDEGLSEAETVLVVVSSNSLDKPWVREELNTAIGERVNRGAKIIPVVLDGVKAPKPLNVTLWEEIQDLGSYDESLKKIVASIFDVSLKPPIGQPPDYVTPNAQPIEGLTLADSLILQLSCESMNTRPDESISPGELFTEENRHSLSKDQILTSIKVLSELGYVEVDYYIGGSGNDNWGCHYTLTTFGFAKYCEQCVPDYGGVQKKIIACIVNERVHNSTALSEQLDISKPIVINLIHLMENLDLVKTTETLSIDVDIWQVSPRLGRMLD